MVSQYFCNRDFGSLDVSAQRLVADHINLCVSGYYKGFCRNQEI